MAESRAVRKKWALVIVACAIACLAATPHKKPVRKRAPPRPAAAAKAAPTLAPGAPTAAAASPDTPVTAPEPAPADLYGKWWSVCDNGADCAVLGTGGEGTAITVMLRRGPEAQAPVRATVITDPSAKPTGPVTWRLLASGKTFATVQASEVEGVMQAELSSADGKALAARLTQDQVLRVEGPGANASLSTAGAAMVLRSLDEIQGRAGGVTALAVPGRAGAAAVPHPPELPIVAARRISAQSDLPAVAPNSAVRDQARCRGVLRTFQRAREFKVYRLGPDALLWMLPCGTAGTQAYDMVLVSDGRGERVRPALPADATIEDLPNSVRNHVSFDVTSGVLMDINGIKGSTDCGRATEWMWTGQDFTRVREYQMDECVGVPMTLWPDTYRVTVRRAG
ncbi:hypothetical protein BH11PSE2_BH11PSE2_20210 [soil metagenome]